MYVVVYGTLKRGYGNNHFLSNATFVSPAVVRNHRLWYAGFPVAQPSEGDTIIGELWEVEDDDEDTIRGMDRLEGVPSMYTRETVIAHSDIGSVESFMYVGGEDYWSNFQGMRLCPINDEGHYIWNR